jgi:transcriptional antiterminator NusG
MPFNWFVINTYSGHENKVRLNLLQRIKSLNQEQNVKEIVVPTEQVIETKNGQKVQTEKRVFPGYVLVNMLMTDDSWSLVKNTPGVTGFVGSAPRKSIASCIPRPS